MNKNEIVSGILAGDLLALAKGITLVESQNPAHRSDAISIIDQLYAKRKPSIRLGITGIPGVGKSSFIEQLGLHIVSSGLRVAVLAIDPSSSRTAGSILGDKTRMEELSRHPSAFIRPSPSGGTLGGISARTRESMLLCEVAGFDVIIIETVGVGQSETSVINITDTFLMLAMPGTGDELQGIKRGIMERADLIVINKADGSNLSLARKAKKQLEIALHLFPASESGWPTKVQLASALLNEGIQETWRRIQDRHIHITTSGWLDKNRKNQQLIAFQSLAEIGLYELAMQRLKDKVDLAALKAEIHQNARNEFGAVTELLNALDD